MCHGADEMDESLVKRLMSSLKCHICGQHYDTTGIKVLGHRDDFWFLKIFCPACRSQSLIAAVIGEDKPLEVITDLTEAEFDRFKQNQIVANDVLDIHNILKGFDGDFSILFAEEDQ